MAFEILLGKVRVDMEQTLDVWIKHPNQALFGIFSFLKESLMVFLLSSMHCHQKVICCTYITFFGIGTTGEP
jgi:hypothetical protein